MNPNQHEGLKTKAVEGEEPAGAERRTERETQEAFSGPDAAAEARAEGGAEAAGPAGLDPEELARRLETTEKEARENYDRLLRVSAEFENFKKRQAREMEDLRKFANRSLLREMLSVVDHMEMALQAAADRSVDDPLKQGLALTLRELQRVLEKFEVKPIEAEGRPFNPEFHEAILQEETAAVPPNTVLRVMQRGYLLNDRLLRPALVVVSSPAAEPSREGDGGEKSDPGRQRDCPPA
ncbi:MAG: nucleotide exchange factor GrpE [Desulfobacterales bacterium]